MPHPDYPEHAKLAKVSDKTVSREDLYKDDDA